MTSPNAYAATGTSAGADPVIRPYRDEDSAPLLDCFAELQDSERAIDGRLRPGRAIASDYLVAMLDECRRWVGQIFVLEVDNAVAGFTTVYARVPFERLDEPPGDYAIVAELLVRSAYRRRGYARALLAHGERYAVSQGAAELRIGVLSDNTAARALYLDYGFRQYIETLSKPLEVFHSQPPLVASGDVTQDERSGGSE
jgi:ribosomal protein S18 acetylase RimI-like enzyme